MYQRENSKLEDHILRFKKQNENIIDEIEQVIKGDNHMKNILIRNDKINTLLYLYSY